MGAGELLMDHNLFFDGKGIYQEHVVIMPNPWPFLLPPLPLARCIGNLASYLPINLDTSILFSSKSSKAKKLTGKGGILGFMTIYILS